MKMKTARIIVLFVFVWSIFFLAPAHQKAASENSLRLYNVAGQATFTLLKGVIQGKVKTFKDVTKMLFYGSVSGYGFYQSKKMIGKGHITPGVLLANLSASISENTALGRHPLSHIGYTLGPARIEFATPFAHEPAAIVNLSVIPRELAGFVSCLKEGSRLSFRNGMFVFTAAEGIQPRALGWTRGMYPTVLENHQSDYVYNHETIHVVQNIQAMSLSPEPLVSSERGFGQSKPRLFSFNGIRMNFLGLGMDLFAEKVQSYATNIYEVEAYHFAKKQ